MLWVVVFALPVVKMALLAGFLAYVWRHERGRGDEVEVTVGIGPDRPRTSRHPRGGDRGGPGRRPLRRAPVRARRVRL